jgi:N-acetylneuraminic acid mutarotase
MRIRVVIFAANAVALLALSCGSPDPPLEAWTVAARLPVPRFEAYAATWGAHVYFIGGITGQFADISTAEPSRLVDVYDAASDTWTAGPDLPSDAPKHHLAIAVMSDGIDVLGGFDGIVAQHPNEPFVPVARAYALRDPKDGVLTRWVALAPPPLARGAATAQAIDGKIYVTGGATTEGVPPFDELDVYDPDANVWSTSAPMPTAREHLASCATDGKFVVVGGWNEDVASNAAESFDPTTQKWTVLPALPTARGGLAAISRAGVCHVIGGEDWALPFPGTFHAHEVYDPKSNAWSDDLPMPTARHGFGLALLGGAMYAVGGGPSQGNSYTDVVEVLVP